MASAGVGPREMRWVGRWMYALKPGSWPKLLVPALLGQILGITLVEGGPSWTALALGAAFTVADLTFIVLMNDWGDQAVDRVKRELFPDGCSPKTIPDGILSARAVLMVGIAAGLMTLSISALGELYLPRPGLFGFGLVCVGMFVAYSLPPFALNYRGGGELLELLGVGVALPVWHLYAQAGFVSYEALAPLGGFACLAFASAVASGLSDEVSDREGGKRTFTTWLGNASARRLVQGAVIAGGVGWVLTAILGRPPSGSVMEPMVWSGAHVAAALVVGAHYLGLRRVSADAQTNAFGAQKEYKKHLHRAIWRGTTMLSLGLVVGALL